MLFIVSAEKKRKTNDLAYLLISASRDVMIAHCWLTASVTCAGKPRPQWQWAIYSEAVTGFLSAQNSFNQNKATTVAGASTEFSFERLVLKQDLISSLAVHWYRYSWYWFYYLQWVCESPQMFLYVLLCCVGVVHCYGHGRVSSVCGSMTPSHGSNIAQSSIAPFTVTADNTTFKEGDQITG